MPISFPCPNIKNYDQELGQYVRCGEMLSSDESEIGNRIRCPACGQFAPVPDTRHQEIEQQLNSITGEAKSEGRSLDSVEAVSESGSAAETESFNIFQNAESAASVPKTPGEMALEAAPLVDTLSELDDDFVSNSANQFVGTASNLRFDAFDLKRVCPRCENAMDKNGRCTKCKYGHEPATLPEEVPLEHFNTRPAGLSLWLQRFLSEDISIGTLVSVSYIFLAVMCALCGISGLVLGGPAIVVLALLFAPMVAAFIYTTQYWVRVNTLPAKPLQFWQQIPWDYLLGYCRSQKWNRKPGLVIDKRNQKIGDKQIATLNGIGKAEVLDLEGTELTDQGLLMLYEFHQVRCLVVRNTFVTDEGIFRLQQHNRRMWIWS